MNLSDNEATFLIMQVMAGYIQKLAKEHDVDLETTTATVLAVDTTGLNRPVQMDVNMAELICEILSEDDAKLDS